MQGAVWLDGWEMIAVGLSLRLVRRRVVLLHLCSPLASLLKSKQQPGTHRPFFLLLLVFWLF